MATFKIGEFSRLTQLPVKTLRYYDEIGLFEAAEADARTRYRHYTAEQLPRLNRILALRDLGFTLAEIRSLVTETITADQLRGMLLLRRAELQLTHDETASRLTNVEIRLNQIEQESTSPTSTSSQKMCLPRRLSGHARSSNHPTSCVSAAWPSTTRPVR